MESLFIEIIKHVTILPLIIAFSWLIDLAFFKVKLEIHLLKTIYKMLMHCSRVFFISIFGGLIFLYFIDLYFTIFKNDSLENYNFDEVVIFYITATVLIFGICLCAYIPLTNIKTTFFYIVTDICNDENKDKVVDKLYIIKSIDNGHILLSNEKHTGKKSIQIIHERSFLNNKKIFTEKENILKEFYFKIIKNR